MENRRNYYRVLHVQPDAPPEIIRASYRTLMQRLRMHPDLGGDHWNAALINEAFRVLGDRTRRAAYDRSLRMTFDAMRMGAAAHGQAGRTPGAHAATSACPFCGTLHPARQAALQGSSCDSCGSPLYPAVRLRLEDASRRALDRVPRHMALDYCVSWPADRTFEGTTDDVSIAGMQFTGMLELAIEERLRIDCAFCSAVAVVRHVRPNGRSARAPWRTGVEFLTLRVKRPRGSLVSAEL